MLNPELQASIISNAKVFLPVHGGWGRMGATHIRLADANETQLKEALYTAWKLRVEKNDKSSSRRKKVTKRSPKRPKE